MALVLQLSVASFIPPGTWINDQIPLNCGQFQVCNSHELQGKHLIFVWSFQLKDAHYTFVLFKILINRFKCHQTVLLKLLNVEPLTRDLFRAEPRVALQREYKVRDTQTDTQTDRRN